jgi:hypothetical protein
MCNVINVNRKISIWKLKLKTRVLSPTFDRNNYQFYKLNNYF